MKINDIVSAVLIVVVSMFVAGCGSSSTSSGTNTDAATYAKFGQTTSDAVPAGLKDAGASASISAEMDNSIFKNLSPADCASSYIGCPYITATGGADSTSGEILSRLWGIDYQSACSTTYLQDGTCFTCAECNMGDSISTNFIKPTMLASPASCVSISTTVGRYVNFGVDPCFFDTMIGQISNIKECETVSGGEVDVHTAIPWYASWDIPQTITFSSYYAKSGGGGIWWTVNSGASGNTQYFLSLDTNWLYSGIKDTANNRFLFLGTGSPSYYNGRDEGNGVNIAAYAGTITGIPAQFEAIQVRYQDPNKYIERLTTNSSGTHLWYQSWSDSAFPETAGEVASKKNSPSMVRCLEIGTSVAKSKYVPLSECVTNFDVADQDALNLDDNYILKVIDGQTANSIDFSTSLTPSITTDSCLPEDEVQGQ